MEKLKSFDFANNLINNLQPGVFNGLSSVENIYLNGNKLTEIPSGVFINMPKLDFLDLSGNQINHVATDAFDSVKSSLTGIDLTGNDLLTIGNMPPAQFFVGFLPEFEFMNDYFGTDWRS